MSAKKSLKSFRFSDFVETQLDIFTKATGLNQTEIVLIALNDFFEKYETRLKVMTKLNDILEDDESPHKKLKLNVKNPPES